MSHLLLPQLLTPQSSDTTIDCDKCRRYILTNTNAIMDACSAIAKQQGRTKEQVFAQFYKNFHHDGHKAY